MKTCVFCKNETVTHCISPACTWLLCDLCGATLEPVRRRAVRHGQAVAWPYSAAS